MVSEWRLVENIFLLFLLSDSPVHCIPQTFTCCNIQSKFYRYNDVALLLKSRRGRCGEYANCFTFLCRCLGYDARLCHATFDHVWTEVTLQTFQKKKYFLFSRNIFQVYSVYQKRWLHIDPSDNVVDSPLMYQYGWKRDVDYVIAYSRGMKSKRQSSCDGRVSTKYFFPFFRRCSGCYLALCQQSQRNAIETDKV